MIGSYSIDVGIATKIDSYDVNALRFVMRNAGGACVAISKARQCRACEMQPSGTSAFAGIIRFHTLGDDQRQGGGYVAESFTALIRAGTNVPS